MWQDTIYHCSECDKTYTSYQSMWNHKKHKHKNNGNKENTCTYCEKTYSTVGNMNKHMKICKKNPKNTRKNKKDKSKKSYDHISKEDFVNIMLKNLSKEQIFSMFTNNQPIQQPVYQQPVYQQPIQQSVYQQPVQIQPLEQPLELEAVNDIQNNLIPTESNIASNQHNNQHNNQSNNNHSNNTTNSHNTQNNNTQNNTNSNNTQNNTNSNNTNINIQIVPLGQENLTEVLSTNEQVKILKQNNKSLETMIKYVHFNQKYPQFQNIAIKDFDSNTGHMYDDETKEFIEVPKDDLIIDVIENRMNDIYDFMVKNENNISKKNYNIIEAFTDKFDIQIHENREREKVEYLLYKATKDLNKRKLILKSK